MAGFFRRSAVLRHRVCLVGAALVTVLVPSPVAVGAAEPGGTGVAVCRDLDVPVVLDGSLPARVHGRLCHPLSGPSGTVQLLLHGGTYNRTYWDFPYEPDRYSYVRAAARRGYSTLNVDRVGYGGSSTVPSASLTGSSQANVIHQIVEAARHGAIAGMPFSKVVLVGHSLGSGVSILEAATYQDVDGVVLTGAAHPFTPHAVTYGFVGHFQPAFLDPHFAGQKPDPGYITTVPGARAVIFYSNQVDSHVLTVDEATKDKASTVEPVRSSPAPSVDLSAGASSSPRSFSTGPTTASSAKAPAAPTARRRRRWRTTRPGTSPRPPASSLTWSVARDTTWPCPCPRRIPSMP